MDERVWLTCPSCAGEYSFLCPCPWIDDEKKTETVDLCGPCSNTPQGLAFAVKAMPLDGVDIQTSAIGFSDAPSALAAVIRFRGKVVTMICRAGINLSVKIQGDQKEYQPANIMSAWASLRRVLLLAEIVPAETAPAKVDDAPTKRSRFDYGQV